MKNTNTSFASQVLHDTPTFQFYQQVREIKQILYYNNMTWVQLLSEPFSCLPNFVLAKLPFQDQRNPTTISFSLSIISWRKIKLFESIQFLSKSSQSFQIKIIVMKE